MVEETAADGADIVVALEEQLEAHHGFTQMPGESPLTKQYGNCGARGSRDQ